MEPIGDFFQQQTKYVRNQMPNRSVDWAAQPPLYKHYPNSDKIELLSFDRPSADSLSFALHNRKSLRNFTKKPISLKDLSFLLWAATGISRQEQAINFGLPLLQVLCTRLKPTWQSIESSNSSPGYTIIISPNMLWK